MLCASHPNQCTIGAVMLAALCAKAVQINWSQFLLNDLLQDAASSQEEVTAFHYSWLFILISFIISFELADY